MTDNNVNTGETAEPVNNTAGEKATASAFAPKWDHEISRNGLSMVSSTPLPDGGTWSVTVRWDDIATAKKNYASARSSAEKAFEERDTSVPSSSEPSNSVRVVAKLFGRKIRVGRSKNQKYDEAAVQFGSKKATVNLDENGKWDGKNINFTGDESKGSWLAGFGGGKNAFWISVDKS